MENSAPMANFTADPQEGTAPLTVIFDASGSYDPDGKIVEYRWDLGDGSYDFGMRTSHTYYSAGVYMVKLTVVDDQGAKAYTEQLVRVNFAKNARPVARFSATPVEGKAPLTVHFDASASYDPDGRIVKFHWDFGDRTRGVGTPICHTFHSAGVYTVSLVVVDDKGAASTPWQEVINVTTSWATHVTMPNDVYIIYHEIDKALLETSKPLDRIDYWSSEVARFVNEHTTQSAASWLKNLCKIWETITGSWIYIPDNPEGYSEFKSASRTLRVGYRYQEHGNFLLLGDCEDFAIVVAACLKRLGLTPLVIWEQTDEAAHAYPVLYVGDTKVKVQKVVTDLRHRYPTAPSFHFLRDLVGKYWLLLDRHEYPGGPPWVDTARIVEVFRAP